MILGTIIFTNLALTAGKCKNVERTGIRNNTEYYTGYHKNHTSSLVRRSIASTDRNVKIIIMIERIKTQCSLIASRAIKFQHKEFTCHSSRDKLSWKLLELTLKDL